MKSSASSMREKVMGSVPDPGQMRAAAGDTAGSAKEAMGSAASTVGDAVTGAPQTVKQQAQGNPLGAGLVAFGVGLVLSSLIPASEREKQLAAQAQDKAMGPVQDKAREMGEQLQGSVQQSAQQVKDAVSQATQQTKDQAQSAVEDVKAPLQQ
jgi:uncharacterized protein YjbJ (UPF0337 family)